MKKLLILPVLLYAWPALSFGQGSRFSSQVTQAASIPNIASVFVIIPPVPIINWCAHPANAVPCTNKVTTYTTAALTTPCSTSTQIVLDGTTSCVANPDSQNNWGVWVGPGAYDYTITIGTNNYGPFYVTEPCVSTGCTLTSPTITSPTITGPTITNPTTTGTDSGTETLSSKTLTAPIINGTPTGTGISTITLKKGSGGGNYTTASTSYVDVDATNLSYTVTIPTGWKLAISASGQITSLTAVAGVSYALFDSSVINEGMVTPSAATFQLQFGISWSITGDGASHTVKLQYKTANASDSASITNSSATLLPTMVFTLSPSN